MIGPFTHQIDPVIADLGGVCLWWYGLGYAIGFLELHLWLRHARGRLGLSLAEVYKLSLLLVGGVLVGGRFIEVGFYEWPFYGQHPWLIPAVWLGGMATHGLVLGAVAGAWLFSRWSHKPLLLLLDELVIPGAVLLAVGRLGNFIDGQIVGSPTDVWWGVKFPDADGFRHPVVLYDGLKNLLMVPLLWCVRRTRPRPGVLTAHFVFWYGFLRIFVDLFREYPTTLLGLATGQSFNLWMALLGVGLWIWFSRKPQVDARTPVVHRASEVGVGRSVPIWVQPGLLVVLLAFCTVIPSDWTQDIPLRYGKRHAGLHYSAWYHPLDPS